VGAELDGVTALGCEAVCTLAAMAGADGSGVQAKRDPKGKCWTTGNLERTSALYIFIMPCFVVVRSVEGKWKEEVERGNAVKQGSENVPC
jgi:hypothetical protein